MANSSGQPGTPALSYSHTVASCTKVHMLDTILRAPRKCAQVTGIHQGGRGAHFSQSFR
jgi:hypothetical protein